MTGIAADGTERLILADVLSYIDAQQADIRRLVAQQGRFAMEPGGIAAVAPQPVRDSMLSAFAFAFALAVTGMVVGAVMSAAILAYLRALGPGCW